MVNSVTNFATWLNTAYIGELFTIHTSISRVIFSKIQASRSGQPQENSRSNAKVNERLTEDSSRLLWGLPESGALWTSENLTAP